MKKSRGIEVNDAQSKLNSTWVNKVVRPESVKEIQSWLEYALEGGYSVSVAGGRHAMGGQQFGAGTIHFDMSGFSKSITSILAGVSRIFNRESNGPS